jgi:broad specificity phosphatase PhoE
MKKIVNQKRLRLYLIRHGEVEGAEAGRLLGRTDAPLSERGREQSRQLADFLSRERLTSVYSSDLLRARTMADTIARRSNLEVRESSAWREIDMGEWEGRTFATLHDEAPRLVAQLFNDPARFVYPHGESQWTRLMLTAKCARLRCINGGPLACGYQFTGRGH